ncbi:hypothetical protein V1521DRAFT_443100 [Lipomyces starkeyi]
MSLLLLLLLLLLLAVAVISVRSCSHAHSSTLLVLPHVLSEPLSLAAPRRPRQLALRPYSTVTSDVNLPLKAVVACGCS